MADANPALPDWRLPHLAGGNPPGPPPSVAASMQYVAFAPYASILAPSVLALARHAEHSLFNYVLLWVFIILFSSLL